MMALLAMLMMWYMANQVLEFEPEQPEVEEDFVLLNPDGTLPEDQE